MASIADAGHVGWARGALTALLRRWHSAPQARVTTPQAAVTARSDRRDRRHYPPQRDRVMEQAAMAREMYRL
ncbi:hypothetical protein MJO55_04140 [Mycolicibacterium rufum]|uniref:Uncharacterized protein n=1 Tax=Mycolicibacterium rufum TaxID=318424 RepID=A0A9X2XX63_9MYCO|nr:hypothetical protein [Mycolicibacterium rufum]KGI66818.1 hypothetical protein EU78_04320 [Mycolicibacterium rufum]MCV7070577.1 hypothetical protein [Mycolicibacterium rufum]ULP37633.1 hypothetical protein MJO55_04140 [Mycolicibacterium rufum]